MPHALQHRIPRVALGCQHVRVPCCQGKRYGVAGDVHLKHSRGLSVVSVRPCTAPSGKRIVNTSDEPERFTLMQAWPVAQTNGRTAPDSNGAGDTIANPYQAPVVVWYKHDLRVHDHPGLSKALSSNRPVVGFFCFDEDVFSDQVCRPALPECIQLEKLVDCPPRSQNV